MHRDGASGVAAIFLGSWAQTRPKHSGDFKHCFELEALKRGTWNSSDTPPLTYSSARH